MPYERCSCPMCSRVTQQYETRNALLGYPDSRGTRFRSEPPPEPPPIELPDCDNGICYCGGCDDDYDDPYGYDYPEYPDLIRNYGYKPTPSFYGSGPVFLGSELEIETPRKLAAAAQVAAGHLGTLGYLKEDGSLSDGFEIVTEPMDYDYAISQFPWKMLSELSSMGCIPDDNCGMHVHVSRAGFSGPAHVYRWMKFFYRNQPRIQEVARRKSNEWAAFSGSERRNIKAYATNGRHHADNEWWDPERYSAINARNSATFEIRVFASTLDEREYKAALGLSDATVEYTRKLTASDILNDGGWRWDTFRDQLPTKYDPLREEIDRLCAC